MLAMFLCYLGGLFVMGLGTRAWRRAAMVLLPVALVGLTLSAGRGGWVGCLAGALYLAGATRIRLAYRVPFAVAACLLIVAYFRLPAFAHQVDMTLWPNPVYLNDYQAGGLGVDDGGRTRIWTMQAPQIIDAPSPWDWLRTIGAPRQGCIPRAATTSGSRCSSKPAFRADS